MSVPPVESRHRHRSLTTRRRLVEALGLVGLLVGATLLYSRGLDAPANYDEGVYLASLDALRHGQDLGTDVYASQPPGFYVLLRALALPGMGIEGIRAAFLLVALVGLVAAYVIGRRLAGPGSGLFAAGLLAITAPYPVQVARVQADTASVALALAVVAVAMYAGRSPWRWAAAGLLAGCAISVKLLALPVLVPLAVLLVARRSWRAAGATLAAAAVVWIALAVAYGGAFGELWESVIGDHRRARSLGPSLADNAQRVLGHPLDWRTAAAMLVVIGLVCCVLFLRRVETLALGAWIVASAVFLVYQRPLLDHHLVLLATTLAVPAGAGLAAGVQRLPRAARLGAVAALALALVAGVAQEGRRLDRLGNGEPADVRAAADELRSRTAPDDLVASDLPIVTYLADRRMPGRLVDTSFVRLGNGSLSEAEILAALDRHHVRAVVVGREFANRPSLLRELGARYSKRVRTGVITLYLAPSP